MPRLTMVLSCIILLQMTGCTIKSSENNSTDSKLRTEIVAHRGASFYAPENTTASFELAWQQNADAIEGDFYLTADGQIVCIHDKNTKRTSGIDMVVENATFEQLKAIDVGSWKDPKYAVQRIITLEQVLKMVPSNKKVYLHLKGPEVVKPMVPFVKKSGLKNEQIVVLCFDAEAIAQTRRLLPDVKALWLAGFKFDKESKTWSPSVDEILKTLKRIDAHGLDSQADRPVIDANFVRQLRDKGYELHVWTIDEPDAAKYFYSLGVDSITTNRPDYIREVLTSTISKQN